MTNFYMEDNFCTSYKLQFHRLQNFLSVNGFTIVSTPQKANIMIAGVCAAFDADEEKSLSILANNPTHIIGCMVKVRPDKMINAQLFYSWEYEKLATVLIRNPLVSWENINTPTKFRSHKDYRIHNRKKHFVSITQGCWFNCSYCPHKLGSGELISYPANNVLSQIRNLLYQDIDTIVITGIDTASYGKDINTSFPSLMNKILTITNKDISYHIAQFNPEGISLKANRDLMLQCCSNHHIKDLQLPVQTTSPRLLKLMNRNYDIPIIANFIKQVKTNNKELFLRTDLIVGFPTETDAELNDSISFVSQYFSEVALYSYEHKDRTPIAITTLPLHDIKILTERMTRARKQLKDKGIIVHSGGQDTPSLLKVDRYKEKHL